MASALTRWRYTIFRATPGRKCRIKLAHCSPAPEVGTPRCSTLTICSYLVERTMTLTSLLTSGLITSSSNSGKKLALVKILLSLVVATQLTSTASIWSFSAVSETLSVSLTTSMSIPSETAPGPPFKNPCLLLETQLKAMELSPLSEALALNPAVQTKLLRKM